MGDHWSSTKKHGYNKSHIYSVILKRSEESERRRECAYNHFYHLTTYPTHTRVKY